MIIRNIALQLIASRFGVAVMQNFDGMAGFFQKHLAGTDNLRVVSIILLLLAFTLFLFLVIILYIKSLLNFIKNEGENVVNGIQAAKLPDDLSKERAQEQELSKEIEKSQQQKAEWLRRQELLKNAQQRRQMAEEELQKHSRRKNMVDRSKAERVSGVIDRFADMRSGSDRLPPKPAPTARNSFDWSPNQTSELDEFSAGIVPFRSAQATRSLSSMSGMILNMLGRNIDVGKIAQTVKSACGDSATEEDVIQYIDTIRNFVALSNGHKFASLPDAHELPTPEEALYDLAQNDSTYCLQLLQSLMNATIDRADAAKLTQKRDLALAEAANYACMFGNLAAPDNLPMATEAYEMAVELSDKNVNAWSRVADMYDANQPSKAIWAYQHLLKIADETQHIHQISNAQKHLAQYYYDQGDSAQATKLYDISSRYYEGIGINQPLTPREREIIKIIESKQQADIDDTLGRLLQTTVPQQKRSFV